MTMPAQRSQAAPRWRANSAWRLLSLLPFGWAAIIVLTSPLATSPMFAKPPDILGIPLALVFDGLLLAWAGLGARVVWMTRSSIMASLALVATTAPAIVLLTLTPAIILIMQNLAM